MSICIKYATYLCLLDLSANALPYPPQLRTETTLSAFQSRIDDCSMMALIRKLKFRFLQLRLAPLVSEPE